MEFDSKRAQLFPSSTQELITEDTEVQNIDMYAVTLYMVQHGFKAYNPDVRYKPGYDPRDISKLYLLGYPVLNAIASD